MTTHDESRSAEPKSTREALLDLVRSSDSGRLAIFGHSLGIGVRGAYPEADGDPQECCRQLQATNETFMVIFKQLAQLGGAPGFGYPDDAFVDVLLEKGRRITSAIEIAVRIDGERSGGTGA
jgi:hypothetical protein